MTACLEGVAQQRVDVDLDLSPRADDNFAATADARAAHAFQPCAPHSCPKRTPTLANTKTQRVARFLPTPSALLLGPKLRSAQMATLSN